MNRTFALFLAIAILVAHALALHKNAVDDIAPPYDQVYVAFRLARNLVQGGQMSWDGLTPGFQSYPSLLWIGLAAVAERTYVSVNFLAQLVSTVSSVLTVIVVAQFIRDRLAGVIAPLLFVFSGCAAAAAGSGTEAATLGLFMTLTFLAFEQRWRKTFSVVAALTCLTRVEGVAFVAVLFVMELVRSIREEPDPGRSGENPPSPSLLASFVPSLLVVLGVALLHLASTGELSSPWVSSLLDPAPGQWARGGHYLQDFLMSTGGPLLIVFPAWYLTRGSLSPLGKRAFLLTMVWLALVGLAGGGTLPFFQALVPILAILFVAVQEAMTVALDSRRRGLPQLTWVLFLLGLAASGITSKYPGDLGPLPVEGLHRGWMGPRAQPRFGYEGRLGRLGLVEEIENTEKLRAIGIYLRDLLDPVHSVLTPWPGSIGYLSRLEVIDLFGRTSPAAGAARTRPWSGRPRADVVAALDERPDYVVPIIQTGGGQAPSLPEVARRWAEGIDQEGAARFDAIQAQLALYEMVTVPFVREHTRVGTFRRNRFFLLRRRDLGLAPQLHLELEGRRFRVEMEHRSIEQLADLRVSVIERGGGTWSMRPTGDFHRAPNVLTRTSMLLFPTGMRRVELVAGEIPAEIDAVEVRAVLRNPGAIGQLGFAPASEEVVRRVE